MQKPTLLVLAAGMGSRYGGSKQVDPVGPYDEIVLDYSVYDAWRAGFGKVVFVIQEQMESLFRELFDAKLAGKMEVEYAFQKLTDLPDGFSCPAERTKPWGTGHAVWSAHKCINEPFAVINADDFYGKSSYETICGELMSGEPSRSADTFCMVAFRLGNTLSKNGSVSRGICSSDSDDYLYDVTERTKIEAMGDTARFVNDSGDWEEISLDTPVSMNMWGLTPKLMEVLADDFADFLKDNVNVPKSEFFIPFVIDNMIKRGSCKCVVRHSNEQWFGMTYKEDRDEVVANLQRLITAGVYPENLWG